MGNELRETAPMMGRAAGCFILSALAGLPAWGADEVGGAAFAGRPILELRPRYSHIEESNKPEAARGVTLRAIAGWRTAPWHGWRLTVEAIHTGHLGSKRFNDDPASMNTSPYPLLPDPRHTGVNQAHVEGGWEALRLRAGRQVVRFDNQRWASDNDFRQIPQLFDGVTATLDAFENAAITLGHYRRVRATSGQTARLRLSAVHGAWNPWRGHALSAYGYFHDQAQNGAFTGFADNSYRVAGARAEGAFENVAGFALPSILEAALQRPYAGDDPRVDAEYWRIGGGISGRDWTLRYDYEVKGSNGGLYGLQMPLTDFYAFNGWSLHFFNTPREGLRDSWLTGRLAMGPVTLYAELHEFRSDHRRLDFGRETDLGLTWHGTPDLAVRLQHARYDPGIGAGVRKTWLTLSYSY